MKRLLLLSVLLCWLPGFGLDQYGGDTNRPCSANANAITYSISQVASTTTTKTYTLSATASPVMWVNEPVVISGTSVSSGAFNTPAATIWYVSSVPNGTSFVVTVAGSTVGTTADSGTVTLRTFYTQKFSNAWWTCTPLQNALWLNAIQNLHEEQSTDANSGINHQTVITTKFASGVTSSFLLNWIDAAQKRMQSWNFNTLGEYSRVQFLPTNVDGTWANTDNTPFIHMPFFDIQTTKVTRNVQLNAFSASQAGKGISTGIKLSYADMATAWGGHGTYQNVDPFDPSYTTNIDSLFNTESQVIADTTAIHNDYFIGFMIDDSDNMGFSRAGADYLTVRNGSTEAAPGSGGPHFGLMTLITAPEQAVGVVSRDDGFNVDTIYPDKQVYAKTELASWLQGTTDSTSSVTASRTAGVVTYTSASHIYVLNELITVKSCSDSTFNTVAGTGVMITSTTSSTFVATLAGAGSSATGCVVTTGPGYASIGALNTAWSSNYSTFGTSATTVTGEAYGTGNGATTSFSHTFTNVPTPLSVQIKVGGVQKGGDDGAGPNASSVTATGTFRGSGVTSGTSAINYSTKTSTTVFTVAPGNTVAIVADYKTGGWGAGSGLLDEDGKCPATGTCWMPSNTSTLAGSITTATFKTDMDNFLMHFSKKYFSVIKSKLTTYRPGRLLLGITGMGGWCAPSRRQVYWGAAPYLDILGLNQLPCGAADDQSRYDFVISHIGDKPFINWNGFPANVDSMEKPQTPTDNPEGNFTTQALRAARYATRMTQMLTLTGTNDSTRHFIGQMWWSFMDGRGEQTNWGLVDFRDNAYNSTETATGTVACASPLAAYNCGGESGAAGAPYGDFLTTVTDSNNDWLAATGAFSSTTKGITMKGGTIK